MKKSHAPKILSLCLSLISVLAGGSLYSQAVYNTTAAGGSWSAGGSWAGGSAPGNWNNHTANIFGNVAAPSAIQGFTAINLYNGMSFTSGTASVPQDLTLQGVADFAVANGNMTVYGDLTLSGSSITVTSGSLTVTGNLSINYGSTVTVASGMSVSVGSLSTSNNSDAILNNNGTLTVNGDVSTGGVINNAGTLNVNGSLTSTSSSSSILTNNGDLNITGDVEFQGSGKINVNPGAQTIVDGSVTVRSNENLVIGTNVAPPPYADMVVRGDLVQSNSGDVTINQNGRFAIFGDVTDSNGGGTLFTINNGGQVYVEGDINYSGGGSSITNNNSTDPFGFYVGGTITNSGGGSTTTPNVGDEQTMYDTNLPFYNWVNSFSTPLPVTLLYLEASATQQTVSLTWATASELNFEKFVIERSADGKTFGAIGDVKGAGAASTTKLYYAYNDNAPLAGRAYYRLKIVDIDGAYEYSQIVAVNIVSSGSDFRLYPNPVVNSRFTINLNDALSTPATVRVLSATGAQVLVQTLSEAESVVELPASLQAGVYIVQVSGASGQRVAKIVVQ